jgi:hypothetical protein
MKKQEEKGKWKGKGKKKKGRQQNRSYPTGGFFSKDLEKEQRSKYKTRRSRRNTDFKNHHIQHSHVSKAAGSLPPQRYVSVLEALRGSSLSSSRSPSSISSDPDQDL